jgi:hypothetical protein
MLKICESWARSEGQRPVPSQEIDSYKRVGGPRRLAFPVPSQRSYAPEGHSHET